MGYHFHSEATRIVSSTFLALHLVGTFCCHVVRCIWGSLGKKLPEASNQQLRVVRVSSQESVTNCILPSTTGVNKDADPS